MSGIGRRICLPFPSPILSPAGPDASLCHDVVCVDILALFDVWAQCGYSGTWAESFIGVGGWWGKGPDPVDHPCMCQQILFLV